MTEATRVILDSNVWLDLVLFDDPPSRPLLTALEGGQLVALIDAACFDELRRVLQYPQFARFGPDWAPRLARVEALTERFEQNAPSGRALTLPRCTDRDDQKFLSLACDSQAEWLLSRDRAVLKLAGRVRSRFGFAIATPQRFLAAWAAPRANEDTEASAAAA
ncbi:putative toxin-antitoxin system toxin component, PIN family [Chitinasiproducens palmae]|uniref:Putative toxin-antitoxin system toxin component, PIN family n=1 Tax=Chitinasiproducens palmae TaxID=1770053 RepID=A0A1H2PSI1_9BURK|nr:putative toxin-antitoxin system toxin component, PIN family [Chitinasiproducens palmae]SDV49985.1 putative toxin-antitoxin system toxin component, PIN family [Chitinasiproducens palmae]